MNAAKIIFYMLATSGEQPARDLREIIGHSRVNASMWPIYRHVAPEKETAPFIVYSQMPSQNDQTAIGMKVRTVRYLITVWSDNPDQADTIAELAIDALDNTSGEVDGLIFDNCLYVDDMEVFAPNLEPPLYGRQLEFQIRIAL